MSSSGTSDGTTDDTDGKTTSSHPVADPKPFNGIYDPDWSKDFAKNDRAGELLGYRRTNVVVIDEPCELGYHCPVCEYETVVDGNYDERLTWSEYNSFMYCYVCDKDYPSAFCHPLEPSEYTPGSVDIFLNAIRDAIARDRGNRD